MTSVESPSFTIVPEMVVQQDRFSQLKRLVELDMAFSETLSVVNQLESTMPQDWIDSATATRVNIRLGINSMLQELTDKDLHNFALGMAQLGRSYQLGETDAVIVGQSNREAVKEVTEHIVYLQGADYEAKYIQPYNRKSDW